jgi:phosphatidylserine/phosphatidylglycerophosphate/cardiolipin synthase-like enzyme
MDHTAELANAIDTLVAGLPAGLAYSLADKLAAEPDGDWLRRQKALAAAFPQPAMSTRVAHFLGQWRQLAPGAPPQAVALAIRSAAVTRERVRAAQSVELVWTGPDSGVIPLRRTDQALLQLIREAQKTLHVVSFAVYKIEAVVRELLEAAERGVAVSIYLETPGSSEGKVTFDPLGALGVELTRRAAVYVWPLAKRPQSADGRHGSLHAKVALADGNRLLISSANLTEYALSLNMEAGVLISGSAAAATVEQHLVKLVEKCVFVPLART